MDIIEELEAKIHELKEEQAPYDTSEQSLVIKQKETELNTLVSDRNELKSLYDQYEEKIRNIRKTISTIRELEGIEEIPATEIEDTARPIIPATEIEDTATTTEEGE